jgi:cell division septation protein DedD
MRNNETGEYEMVVGNRQLLSGFLIVVLICAVAFAMGYVVGENSRSPKVMQAAAPAASPPASTERDPYSVPPPTAPAVPVADPPQSTTAAAPAGGEVLPATVPPAVEISRPTTRPAQDIQPEKPAPPPSRPVPAPAVAPTPAPAAAAETPSEPPPGSYWQVTATTNRKAAQDLLDTLKEKGFPVMLSPGPNNFTRVLVGPFADNKALGKAKTDLEGAGFSRLVRK